MCWKIKKKSWPSVKLSRTALIHCRRRRSSYPYVMLYFQRNAKSQEIRHAVTVIKIDWKKSHTANWSQIKPYKKVDRLVRKGCITFDNLFDRVASIKVRSLSLSLVSNICGGVNFCWTNGCNKARGPWVASSMAWGTEALVQGPSHAQHQRRNTAFGYSLSRRHNMSSSSPKLLIYTKKILANT